MQTYFFDVTLRVEHNGRIVYTMLYKGRRSESEHLARRAVLEDFLRDGWQVAKIERAYEPDYESYGRIKDGRH